MALFLTSLGAEDLSARVPEVIDEVTDLQAAWVFTPSHDAGDPFLAHEPSPALVLELYFDNLVALERACAPRSPLQRLAGVPFAHQAMLVRRFPVPHEASAKRAARASAYVVGYEGPADDVSAWLAHYIARHPPLMAQLPCIREIEVCTRLDWCSALPWPRQTWMLRNRVLFESPAALAAALRSPVREAMREDYGRLPPFEGKVFHYPMTSMILR